MSNYIYFLLIFELENRVFILGIRAGYNYFSVWLFLDKFSVFKSKDTAHTKSIGIGKVVIIESAVIQVAVIVISAALNRAWPYVHRVAVASICARAAAALIGTLYGAVTWIPVAELVRRLYFPSRKIQIQGHSAHHKRWYNWHSALWMRKAYRYSDCRSNS